MNWHIDKYICLPGAGIDIIEGGTTGEPAYYEALQRAINGGEGWKFQGSYGRAMMAVIEEGRCLHGPRPAQNAWGTRILIRSKVDPGTKGSREFVAAQQGVGWAARMEGV
ncbi:MAG: hypothetical protein CVU20_09365 [Betaproteobacteria bacterium HGW-Betaproteobacteria-14]|nr:MAG: hypothetical protein CVU20_09365 [Betaproteobacteria bacterium HGW-Betaproteobacteria-14]